MTAGSPTSTDRTPTGERKLVTLLFADLSGFTRLTTTRDPEDVQSTVGPVLAALRRIAEEHGGHVPSVQGDGFLAVFGAPVAHTDDPLRAVEAAAAMQAHIAARREDGIDVPSAHVGIASGEVLVTFHEQGLDVLGAAVNLASRLSDAAVPGEVLVDETTAALTANLAAYGPARPMTLAGFSGLVRALPLTGVGPSAAHVDSLVGRSEQLLALERALNEPLAVRTSSVVVLTGAPGVGKSLLVQSWLTSHPELLVLRGSCRAYGSALPLSALSEALSKAPDLDLEPAGSRDTRSDFLRLLPRQRLSGSVGREPDEALPVAARRLLAALAARRPTVLVLEDLHWGEEALIEAVRGLMDDPIAGPLLVVATAHQAVSGLPHLPVPPLSVQEVAEVIKNRVGAPPAASLLALLAERSAGNPLWLVECLALLSERRQLAVEGSVAVARDDAGTVEVPASIRMLVSARLDSLPEGQKRALQRASVWTGDLPVSRWPGDPADIAPLVEQGLLTPRPGEQLRFSHGLVREAVYRSMPRAARVVEHEQLLAASPDPAARAHSALEVQRLDVAPDTARRREIADRALSAVTAHARHLRIAHTRAARDVLLRATDIITELDVVAPAACAVLLTELAEVHRDLEEVEAGRIAANRAVFLAGLTSDPDVLQLARIALGEVSVGVDQASARAIAEAVLALDQASDGLRGRGWRLLAQSHFYDDVTVLPHCLSRAFEHFQAGRDLDAAASAARALAWTLSVTADAAFDRWLEVADRTTPIEHALGQGELALIRAVVAQARGEWEESWDAATAAIALIERVGLHRPLLDAVAVAVEVATATGRRADLPGLVSRLSELMDGHRARLQVTGLTASAPALFLLGREAEATQCVERAAALLSAVGPNEAVMVWASRGHLATLAESPDEAVDAFAEAETLAQDVGLALFSAGCRLHRFIAMSSRGDELPAAEVATLVTALEDARALPLARLARSLLAG